MHSSQEYLLTNTVICITIANQDTEQRQYSLMSLCCQQPSLLDLKPQAKKSAFDIYRSSLACSRISYKRIVQYVLLGICCFSCVSGFKDLFMLLHLSGFCFVGTYQDLFISPLVGNTMVTSSLRLLRVQL